MVLTVVLIIIVFGVVIHSVSSIEAVSDGPNCHQSERQALLSFKHHLTDPSNRLSSWVAGGISCCGWHGIVCDNLTGHVLELHLRGPFSVDAYQEHIAEGDKISKLHWLGGKLDDSLLDLKYLHYLDLSNNDFGGIQVPLFVGSMHTLTYLNLSAAGFGGAIPSHLGNLSNLLSLSIAGNGIHTKNLGWLYGLSMIRYLDLSNVMLPNTSDDLQGISALPLLEELHLKSCGISQFPILVNVNFSNLVTLDLSSNKIGSFPGGLENRTSLKYLDLSSCSVSTFPNWLYKFSQLEKLMLGGNRLQGTIAGDIANLTLLSHLDLSYNSLDGEIPRSLRTMCKLEWIDLSQNHIIGGNISDVLSSFTVCASNRLQYISFSGCQLRGSLPFEIGEFKNLERLELSYNDISGTIPDSLGSLNSLLRLDLSHNKLNGALPEALGQLHRLEDLNIGYNSISGTIPDSVGSLNFLVSLDFSENNLSGTIPESLESLSSLISLDLSTNKLNGALPQALGQLHRLEELHLGYNSISSPIPDSVGSLNFLLSLDISSNNLSGTIPESLGSLSSLIFLDLSINKLNGALPQALGQLHRLEELILDYNSISGLIPDFVGSLNFLQSLYLSSNNLSGTVPESLGSLSSLTSLDLSMNKLCGNLPTSLGKLIQLQTLDVSFNSFEGLLSPIFLANLTSLESLYASGNRIYVSPNWIPPPNLGEVYLSSCYLGPKFPKWLSSLENLESLEISDTGIKDSVPGWFWNKTSQMEYLNMSHNHLHGEISVSLSSQMVRSQGHYHHLSSQMVNLDLSNNSLSGHIPSLLCAGETEMNFLRILHLGDNNFFGEIPDCWSNGRDLESIELQNNNLNGSLPKSLGSLSSLRFLHLRNNSLSGVLPSSLQNCTELMIFDIADNKLGGKLPKWIGRRLFNLKILSLGTNCFNGYVPKEFCALSSLVILDMSHNNLSGAIPNCLANFSAMTKQSISDFSFQYREGFFRDHLNYEESAILVTKALVLKYSKNLQFMTDIDLSNNSFSGPIPESIANLVALRSLNLSGNSFTGKIPRNMYNMSALESLDLSMNRLSGEIPQSMASMTFLEFLNVSFNDLVGRIPTGTQIQGFNASSFMGNKLCGPPVSANCGPDEPAPSKQQEDNQQHGLDYDELYVSIFLGYIVGLGAAIAPLLYSPAWRHHYFRWVHSMWDRLRVWTVLLFRTRVAEIA